jgi:hypothetical protein
MEQEAYHNFTYECHKCKKLIPGHFDTADTDEVVMVPEGKVNTWLFECFPCNESGDKDI